MPESHGHARHPGVRRCPTDVRPRRAHRADAPFGDARVAGVSGELVLDCESDGRRDATSDRRAERRRRPTGTRQIGGSRGSAGGRASRRLRRASGCIGGSKRAMRRLESDVDSTLGATGAIYAMRRSLWTPLPPDTMLDDVLAPMRWVLAGYRVVFNERARAFDRTAPDAEAEARRKIRTLAGNYPDSVARAGAAAAVAQCCLAAGPVAQSGPAGRAVCADRAHGHEHRPC